MKTGHHIVSYLKEISIVVLGVLIAVAIGNFKEKLDNQSYLKKTLSAIETEVKSSKADVDSVLARHIALYTHFERNFDASEQSLGKFIATSGGFQIATIRNISLRFFISNKAELLDFKIIAQLLDIEASTNILMQKIERLSEFAYDHVNQHNEEVREKFIYLLADVIESEQSLLESYTAFLNENNEYLRGKSTK